MVALLCCPLAPTVVCPQSAPCSKSVTDTDTVTSSAAGLPSTGMPQYGEADYWDLRYKREPSQFDWYQSYAGLRYLLHQYLPEAEDILQIGVGTSHIQQDMAANGYRHIVNVDYSSVVIELMRELHKAWPQLQYEVVDVRNMVNYKRCCFGGVLDKGTLDAVLCGNNSFDNSKQLLQEVYRVLKPGSQYLLITYGDPPSRLRYLRQEGLDWAVEVHIVTKASEDATPGDGPQVVIKGPYSADDKVLMESLAKLTDVHFVYACCKPGKDASDDEE